jgi:hypothetical protein
MLCEFGRAPRSDLSVTAAAFESNRFWPPASSSAFAPITMITLPVQDAALVYIDSRLLRLLASSDRSQSKYRQCQSVFQPALNHRDRSTADKIESALQCFRSHLWLADMHL